jgi:hypothetical protein
LGSPHLDIAGYLSRQNEAAVRHAAAQPATAADRRGWGIAADGLTIDGHPTEIAMRPKHLYLGLCLLGTVLPYSQFIPFLRENGLDSRAFLAQLFATHIGAFFGWDVIVSSVVLWVMVSVDGRRAGLGHRWVPIVANLAVGVSLALPLFLYMREARREPAV